MSFLIVLAILFAFFWFFVLLPQRRRQRTHAEMQNSLAVGDEVITAGGLHGDVVGLENGVVEIEIAPGTIVRVDRRAIGARVEVEPEDEYEDVEEAEETESAESESATDANPG
jgi:preprotein translocase subunit YajC